MPLSLSPERIVFLFFFFSFSGWIGETLMESGVRRRFVNKGFFKGPYVPVHGVGAFAVYPVCAPLKPYPLLVFLAGTLLCTFIEYGAALFLEKLFHSRGWDYDTYPFTRWCHYKRRVALTTSLFFGAVAFAVVYFYWDVGITLSSRIAPETLFVFDALLVAAFVIDAAMTGARCIRNRRAGIPNKTVGLD
ncbi:MAG: putative ABC transporter permease [Spirochaetaceae bacterium]|jgi:uncharacterized membrane protein|nr:putative ABC transporter permease [Spirochaetaceae bacterium]